MNAFDYSRVIIALMCIGAAEQSLDETIAYVKQRQAFGRPLAKFEGVSFPIAEHATMLEALVGSVTVPYGCAIRGYRTPKRRRW